MSSRAKRVKDSVVQQRISTAVQVLSIMEEEAKRKSFFARFVICCEYLFCKRFNAFFKVGMKHEREEI